MTYFGLVWDVIDYSCPDFNITLLKALLKLKYEYPDSKVHGAKMGPIWGWQDPGGPHVGPMNFDIWVCNYNFTQLKLFTYALNQCLFKIIYVDERVQINQAIPHHMNCMIFDFSGPSTVHLTLQ